MSDIGPKVGVEVPVVILAGGLGTRLPEETVVRPKRWSRSEDITERLLRLSADPDLRIQAGMAACRRALEYAWDAYCESVLHEICVRTREK